MVAVETTPRTGRLPGLLESYRKVRSVSEAICAPLALEDYVIQAMADVSPPKWHLGHTAWFFEAIVLKQLDPDYRGYHDDFDFIFNSYYESLGERVARCERGLLSRPAVKEVYGYRHYIDEAIARLDEKLQGDAARYERFSEIMTIGLHHEQQHQELLLMDIKYNFFKNPLLPAYLSGLRAGADSPASAIGNGSANGSASRSANGSASYRERWLQIEGGLYRIGCASDQFCYDNEGPAHQVYLQDFAIADRPVSCGEYLQFIEAGGYLDFRYWLSEGWHWVQEQKRRAPLYWIQRDGEWHIFTLGGLKRLDREEPLCHVSFYEAAAFASWRGLRLPTEAEWEVAFLKYHPDWSEKAPLAHFADRGSYHPVASPAVAAAAKRSAAPQGASQDPSQGGVCQMFGDVWEWTASAYLPYPGFRTAKGALGEYNGKFMSGQMVLRGGCCATQPGHIRPSYRNFFYPSQSWQFSGLRLAKYV